MSLSFPGERRLKLNSEIRRTLDQGSKFVCRNFVLFARPGTEASTQPGTRLGVIVSKKNGNAVTRNRIKRLTRETYRHMYGSLDSKEAFQGVDIVVIARPGAAQATLEETKRDLNYCLNKLERQIKQVSNKRSEVPKDS